MARVKTPTKSVNVARQKDKDKDKDKDTYSGSRGSKISSRKRTVNNIKKISNEMGSIFMDKTQSFRLQLPFFHYSTSNFSFLNFSSSQSHENLSR